LTVVTRRLSISIVLTVLLCLPATETQALSCAEPQFDADAIEGLAAIFIGVVEKVFAEFENESGTYKSSPGWCGFDLLPKDEIMNVLEEHLSYLSSHHLRSR